MSGHAAGSESEGNDDASRVRVGRRLPCAGVGGAVARGLGADWTTRVRPLCPVAGDHSFTCDGARDAAARGVRAQARAGRSAAVRRPVAGAVSPAAAAAVARRVPQLSRYHRRPAGAAALLTLRLGPSPI
ncbi:MAG: hypothetical protein OJF58_000099 [Enhydrobacter sp.]|nr:MAG: hypothetical protein OJF58_000099 [Enhydrobacter sp.]